MPFAHYTLLEAHHIMLLSPCREGLYAMVLSICLSVRSCVLLSLKLVLAYNSGRGRSSPRVSQMFLPSEKLYHQRKIYASGGGLLVAFYEYVRSQEVALRFWATV